MRNLYLGRLSDTLDEGDYELGTNLRKFDPESGWCGSGLVLCLCTRDLHKLTNIKDGDLKPGTVRKVKITLELL